MLLNSARPQWFTMLPFAVLSKLRLPANKYSTVPVRSAAVADNTLKQNVFSNPDIFLSKYNKGLQGFINIDLNKDRGSLFLLAFKNS